ncbi:MAG: hypothetical protein ABR961_11910 [Thermoanaerobaculaceae bacterium]|jgi:hypothetical protein
MGVNTSGGCGHTDGGTPTTLRNGKAVLEVPDSVRFRADGSNEVMDIVPDVLVGFGASDGPHLRGKRFIVKLPEVVELSLRCASKAIGRVPPARLVRPCLSPKGVSEVKGWKSELGPIRGAFRGA